jgi:hypothetical protein
VKRKAKRTAPADLTIAQGKRLLAKRVREKENQGRTRKLRVEFYVEVHENANVESIEEHIQMTIDDFTDRDIILDSCGMSLREVEE